LLFEQLFGLNTGSVLVTEDHVELFDIVLVVVSELEGVGVRGSDPEGPVFVTVWVLARTRDLSDRCRNLGRGTLGAQSGQLQQRWISRVPSLYLGTLGGEKGMRRQGWSGRNLFAFDYICLSDFLVPYVLTPPPPPLRN
jgi:hypothetical protein